MLKHLKSRGISLLKNKAGVDMSALTKGVIGFGVAVVGLTITAVITSKLGDTIPLDAAGNVTGAGLVARNGSVLIGSVLTDWGAIIILGLILVAVLAPLLFVLIQIARSGSGGR